MSSRAPLWEVEKELLEAYDRLDENEGAHDPAAEMIVRAALTAAEDKRDRVAIFLETVGAYENHVGNEIDRLRKILQRSRDIRARLLGYVGAVMAALGVRELRGRAYGFKIVKNPPRVVVDDFEKIPAQFIREKTIRTPALAELAVALKNGELVPGVHLEQGERIEPR